MDIQLAQPPMKREKVISILEKSSVASELANHQAEDAVIAGVLQSPETYLTMADEIQSSDFTQRMNAAVWYAFEECTNANTPIDLLSIAEIISKYGDYIQSTRTEIIERLAKLQGSTPKAEHIQHHAKLMREAAQRIRLYDASVEVMAMARNKGMSNEQIVDRSDVLITKACEMNATQSNGVKDRVLQFTETLKNAQEHKAGVLTGFSEIDAHNINGFMPRRVTVFAGHSGTGKTTWALSLLRNVCKSGKRVGLFSIEMSADDIMAELTCMESGVYRSKMRGGSMSPRDWQSVGAALAHIGTWNLDIIDNLPRNSPAVIRRNIRKSKTPYDLIIIDGLWITEPDDSFTPLKDWEVMQKNLRKFVKIAKDLHVPIFILHQYSEEFKNADKPTLNALAGGQTIHNDPDEIYGLWRKKGDEMTLVYHLKQRGGLIHKEPFKFFYNPEFNCYETYEEITPDVQF